MSKLSKRDSLLLIVIGAFAIIGGIFWFYVKPARADLSATQQQAQEAQERVNTLNQELARVTALAKKPVPYTVADELRLAKAYPYSSDVPVTLLQLEEVAKKTHVELGDMAPAGDTDYAGVTGTPFTVSVTGKFFDVQDFLYQVHNRVSVTRSGRLMVKGRLFAITSASLAPEGEATDTATTQQTDSKVTASITVVAFSRTPGGGTAGAAATTGTSGAATSTPQGSTTGGTPS